MDKLRFVSLGEAYTFEDYRLKVSRYIEQHKDETAIWKLRNNVKLTELVALVNLIKENAMVA